MGQYKYEPHGPWILLNGVGKSYCLGCGLVNLNNDFTRWCVRMGCNSDEHPQYIQKRKQATKFK